MPTPNEKNLLHISFKEASSGAIVGIGVLVGAGVAVGSLRSHLAGQGSGEVNYKLVEDGYIEVEIATYNPAVMSYAKDRLAAYV